MATGVFLHLCVSSGKQKRQYCVSTLVWSAGRGRGPDEPVVTECSESRGGAGRGNQRKSQVYFPMQIRCAFEPNREVPSS